MIIAIDGPAASGKSSLAHRIALHYNVPHLDTGALYRAVARDLLHANVALDDVNAAAAAASQIDLKSLVDAGLRSRELGEAASIVAVIPEVRTALLAVQRNFIAKARAERGAVIEGRDIGTVICPDAERKIFIVASVEERARRRYKELVERGEPADETAILAELKKRDERDKSRPVAPLVQAPDAYLLDTTKLDIEAALRAAVDYIDAAGGR